MRMPTLTAGSVNVSALLHDDRQDIRRGHRTRADRSIRQLKMLPLEIG